MAKKKFQLYGNQIGELYGCSGKYISKYIKKHE